MYLLLLPYGKIASLPVLSSAKPKGTGLCKEDVHLQEDVTLQIHFTFLVPLRTPFLSFPLTELQRM